VLRVGTARRERASIVDTIGINVGSIEYPLFSFWKNARNDKERLL